ncbi:MAG TPA: hypothetical protein VG273_03525 [Bryobacteraceae bacterium]|jgi:hypothetical protein|nr:hypothetical protein [Bryobacteraceae bacterium]
MRGLPEILTWVAQKITWSFRRRLSRDADTGLTGPADDIFGPAVGAAWVAIDVQRNVQSDG